MSGHLDWKRIERGVRQRARQIGREDATGEVCARLRVIAELCGPGTRHRPAIQRIGDALLKGDGSPVVVAPCCPDYSHENGRYTFRGLGRGISLLTQRHITFLRAVANRLPQLRVLFLLADQEADDLELGRACGRSPAEFRTLISGSLAATREAVTPDGWRVDLFTTVLPDLRDREAAITRQLLAGGTTRARLERETITRRPLYRQIRWSFTAEEMLQRTTRTAAQYITLGQYAAANGMLICNHTTTNLVWYDETGVGILHNPISVY